MESRAPSDAVAGTSTRPIAGTLWVATAEFWARHAFALISRLRGHQVDSSLSAPLAARAGGPGDGS